MLEPAGIVRYRRVMKPLLLLSILSLIQACQRDESVAAYGAGGQDWQLVEIDGRPFAAQAMLRFGEDGAVIGAAPCNNFSAQLDAPYPWFELRKLVTTRATCADQKAEDDFLAALRAMTQSEVSGDTLLLSDGAGREMLFKAAD